MRALFIGNLTIDMIENRMRIGGSGYYGGRALTYLDSDVYVLSYVCDEYRGLVKGVLDLYGIKLIELQCNSMPMFIIEKGKAVKVEGSSCRIDMSIAKIFIDSYRPDILLLTPILNEIDIDQLDVLSSIDVKAIGLDIQGFIRTLRSSRIELIWRSELEHYLDLVDIVHGNIAEYSFSRDEKTVLKKIRDLSSTIRTAFLISLDYRGTYVVYRNQITYIPALSVNAIDEVGAGDILLAVTAYYYVQSKDVIEAAILGVIAASLKVENPYREWFDRELIENHFNAITPYIKVVDL